MPNWINILLGRTKKSKAGESQASTVDLDRIKVGRYSDNNKTLEKINKWYQAEEDYKAKQYNESVKALFCYITDEKAKNVKIAHRADEGFDFEICQGSKRVYGYFDGKNISAKVALAVMEYPGVAIMRRLLELNYNLYYTRTALGDDNTLYLLFDTGLNTASPEKMYYGLRELAVNGDRQDDLLISDFHTLETIDVSHTRRLEPEDLGIKYRYFKNWVTETLQQVDTLNQDSFSGAIAYMLLGLVYRIDFFFKPEGHLLSALEKIHRIYWEKKENTTLVERNRQMKTAIRKLLDIDEEKFAVCVYDATYTFSASTPPALDKVRDHVINANKDAQWYVENKYNDIAIRLVEYGVLYSQFIYSIPKVQTALVKIVMSVIHQDYFEEQWPDAMVYNAERKEFDEELIERTIDKAMQEYKSRYENIRWDHDRIRYSTVFDFCLSFSEQIANMNLKTRRGK